MSKDGNRCLCCCLWVTVPGEDGIPCRVGIQRRERKTGERREIKRRERKKEGEVKREKSTRQQGFQWLQNSILRGDSYPCVLTTVTGQSPFSRSSCCHFRGTVHLAILQLQLPQNLLHPGTDIPILIQRAGRVNGNKHRLYYEVGELQDRTRPVQLQSPSHPRSQLPSTWWAPPSSLNPCGLAPSGPQEGSI